MQAVILAAGKSSRCWPVNRKHKSQIQILGKPLIYWTIQGLARKGIKDIILIISAGSLLKEELSSLVQDLDVKLSYVIQENPLGTGDAIFRAKDLIKKPFFIFWPYKVNSGEIVEKILEKTQEENLSAVLIGIKTTTPWDYGILKFKKEKVIGIVEKPKPGEEDSDIKTVGTYFLKPDFFDYYQKLKKRHPGDFIDALNLYIKDKEAKVILWEKEMPSLKYSWELLGILKIMFNSESFKSYLSPGASIGENVVIRGRVFIEDNVAIGDNAVICGPVFIGKNSKIGANNVLRGPVDLEENVITGAFTEIKNCVVQKGTHFHSGYFGDSVIGEDCRFGAGFITANRRLDRANIKVKIKGKKIDTKLSWLGTIVGNNVSFGIHCGTMPGVLIGSGCAIGPGALVFKNLEDNSDLF